MEQVLNKSKISVREITNEDIKLRNLPNQTTGLVVTKINKDSPFKNSIEEDFPPLNKFEPITFKS